MSNWRPNFRPENFYFVTTKAVDYTHLFQRDVIKRLLVDTLDSFHLHKRLRLVCFVIMPNHLHCIARFSTTDPLSSVLRDFKRQTANRLIRHLKAERKQTILDQLQSKVKRRKKQTYKIWEDGYNAKEVVSETFLLQKMEYIHNNPCQPHWRLSKSPEDYIWSSAGFYLSNLPCIIPIDDVRQLVR